MMEKNESVIIGVLKEELDRNRRIKNRYQKELEEYPRGSLLLRKINNQEYCYLKYRDNGKVISRYLGNKKKVDYDKIKESIKKRKEIEDIIKRLEKEEKDIKKMLK